MMSFREHIVSVFWREVSRDTELVAVFLGRDPDARPPKGLIQHLTYGVWNIWRFFRTNEAIVSVVSLLFIPIC
jgi:hypothetical protein